MSTLYICQDSCTCKYIRYITMYMKNLRKNSTVHNNKYYLSYASIYVIIPQIIFLFISVLSYILIYIHYSYTVLNYFCGFLRCT